MIILDRSHAPALIVIYKCRILVISAWMPKSSVQGWQSVRLGSSQIKQMPIHQVTVHGMDTGIHAGMTAFLARQDLCITARAGAWEPAQRLERRVRRVGRETMPGFIDFALFFHSA